MTNSILLGQALYKILTNDNIINSLIGFKVFPIVAASGTDYPFIVYRKTSINSNGCKDGYYEDNVNFSITILTEDYEQGINISQRIRQLLERQRIKTDLMTFDNCHLTGYSEEYNQIYTNTLNFTTKIN